jgi:hypothetical protein
MCAACVCVCACRRRRDESLPEFLDYITADRNTVVLLMGDHVSCWAALRCGGNALIRRVVTQGPYCTWSSRLPLLQIIAPPRVFENPRFRVDAALANSRRLLGGYDVHKTLLELLHQRPVTPVPFDEKAYGVFPVPVSLLSEVVLYNRFV